MRTGKLLRSAVLGAASVGGLIFASGAAQAGQCRDPWLTYLTQQVLHHDPSGPDADVCNISHYRDGHWNNFGELQTAFQNYWSVNSERATAAPLASLPSSGPGIDARQYSLLPKTYYNGSNWAWYNGRWMKVQGNSLIGQDGAGIAIHNGSNILGNSSSGVVSQGAGN